MNLKNRSTCEIYGFTMTEEQTDRMVAKAMIIVELSYVWYLTLREVNPVIRKEIRK